LKVCACCLATPPLAYKKKAIDPQELGRQLNAQYVIEGSFRRITDQISITAQLIDARSGTHVWAETFDRYFGTGLPSPEAEDSDKRAYLVPRAVEAANRGIELARQSASAHLVLFGAYWLTCRPERMRVEAEQLLAINPNDPGALGFIGTGLIYAGEADQGRQFVEKAIALAGPGAPTFWWGGHRRLP
jgi:hypothetical protein